MNPQSDQDMDLGIQKLEAEINSLPSPKDAIPQPQKPQKPQTDNSQIVQSTLNRFINWFSRISGLGKLLVIGVAAIVGIAILRAVLQVVATVISLAIVGVLLYLGYRLFTALVVQRKD